MTTALGGESLGGSVRLRSLLLSLGPATGPMGLFLLRSHGATLQTLRIIFHQEHDALTEWVWAVREWGPMANLRSLSMDGLLSALVAALVPVCAEVIDLRLGGRHRTAVGAASTLALPALPRLRSLTICLEKCEGAEICGSLN